MPARAPVLVEHDLAWVADGLPEVTPVGQSGACGYWTRAAVRKPSGTTGTGLKHLERRSYTGEVAMPEIA